MQTRVSTETAVIESLSRKSSGVSRAKGAPHTFFAAMIAIGSGCESIWYSASSVCSRIGWKPVVIEHKKDLSLLQRTAVSSIDDSYMSIRNWKVTLSSLSLPRDLSCTPSKKGFHVTARTIDISGASFVSIRICYDIFSFSPFPLFPFVFVWRIAAFDKPCRNGNALFYCFSYVRCSCVGRNFATVLVNVWRKVIYRVNHGWSQNCLTCITRFNESFNMIVVNCLLFESLF